MHFSKVKCPSVFLDVNYWKFDNIKSLKEITQMFEDNVEKVNKN